MAFDISLWTRMTFNGIPLYIRGAKPDWFVPNDAGDHILRACRGGDAGNLDLEARRFLLRLPDAAESCLSRTGRDLATGTSAGTLVPSHQPL